jgi:hypothetical protein
MATVPPHTASTSEPQAIDLIEATGDGLAAGGLVLMSFLGAIPGLLPVVALTVAAGVILLIPMLVLGLVIGALWAIAALVVRLGARAASLVTGYNRAPTYRKPMAASSPASISRRSSASRLGSPMAP